MVAQRSPKALGQSSSLWAGAIKNYTREGSVCMKQIKLTRQELVWETYTSFITEEDFNRIKEEIANDKYQVAFYDVIKDMSFDTLCNIVNGDADDIEVATESRFGFNYNTSIRDYVLDYLREDAWNCGPVDSDYVGDYEENLYIF